MVKDVFKQGIFMSKLLTALVTPFTADDKIDLKALETLINLQIQAQVTGLVILGTTAETELLSLEEQDQIIKLVCELTKNKLQIIVGCGKSSTKETLKTAERAFNFGIDAVMVVSPPYVKPNMTGLYQHFKTISDNKIPFIAYHHPFRTGLNPPLNVLESVLNLPFCQGLKDASGACDIMRHLAQKYTIFSGDDTLILPHLSLGASGLISVCSNLIPEIFIEIMKKFPSHPQDALLVYNQYTKLIEAIFQLPNPIGIKNALSHVNLINDYMRLPYTQADEKSSQMILEAIQGSPKTIGLCPKETNFSLI